jgi:hypothetical protein
MQFVLARFYQDMSEIIHEGYQASRNDCVTPFVQPFAKLHQFVVNPQELL